MDSGFKGRFLMFSIFIFCPLHRKYFWRLSDGNRLERTYPIEIKQFFKVTHGIRFIP